ncbi:MAG: hypothetical protein FWD46_08730 [Cystobacterineae bacterium]|nr:hypothetical protein [Cystobacterineae bacterium]
MKHNFFKAVVLAVLLLAGLWACSLDKLSCTEDGICPHGSFCLKSLGETGLCTWGEMVQDTSGLWVVFPMVELSSNFPLEEDSQNPKLQSVTSYTNEMQLSIRAYGASVIFEPSGEGVEVSCEAEVFTHSHVARNCTLKVEHSGVHEIQVSAENSNGRSTVVLVWTLVPTKIEISSNFPLEEDSQNPKLKSLTTHTDEIQLFIRAYGASAIPEPSSRGVEVSCSAEILTDSRIERTCTLRAGQGGEHEIQVSAQNGNVEEAVTLRWTFDDSPPLLQLRAEPRATPWRRMDEVRVQLSSDDAHIDLNSTKLWISSLELGGTSCPESVLPCEAEACRCFVLPLADLPEAYWRTFPLEGALELNPTVEIAYENEPNRRRTPLALRLSVTRTLWQASGPSLDVAQLVYMDKELGVAWGEREPAPNTGEMQPTKYRNLAIYSLVSGSRSDHPLWDSGGRYIKQKIISFRYRDELYLAMFGVTSLLSYTTQRLSTDVYSSQGTLVTNSGCSWPEMGDDTGDPPFEWTLVSAPGSPPEFVSANRTRVNPGDYRPRVYRYRPFAATESSRCESIGGSLFAEGAITESIAQNIGGQQRILLSRPGSDTNALGSFEIFTLPATSGLNRVRELTAPSGQTGENSHLRLTSEGHLYMLRTSSSGQTQVSFFPNVWNTASTSAWTPLWSRNSGEAKHLLLPRPNQVLFGTSNTGSTHPLTRYSSLNSSNTGRSINTTSSNWTGVVGTGDILYLVDNGGLRVLDAQMDTLWQTGPLLSDSTALQPVLAPMPGYEHLGVLVVGLYAGNNKTSHLRAIVVESPTVDPLAPWPMEMHDPCHTNNASIPIDNCLSWVGGP